MSIARAICRFLAAGIFATVAAFTAGQSMAADAGQTGPAIWRVRTNDSTLFLFGSLHILPAGSSWQTQRIENAMAASDRFIFEVPVGKDALGGEREFILRYGLLPRRQSIRTMLAPGEFDIYAQVMRAAGLNQRDFEHYRPWLAALVLGLAYLHPDSLVHLKGADDDVIEYARTHERPMTYLETPIQQLELLTAGTEVSQLDGLKRVIGNLPSSRDVERSLRDAWMRGDAGGVNDFLDELFARSRATQDFLVGRRNRLWLPAIDAALRQPGVTMVTVGAAHIGGDAGIIALLCNRGYAVERLLDDGSDANACTVPNGAQRAPG